MKKLTRKSLDEMAATMPGIDETGQSSFVGGGTGTKRIHIHLRNITHF